MVDDIVLMLLGGALASVLPNAAVALYDWLYGTGKGNAGD